MHASPPASGEERGAVLVFSALVLAVIPGMTALVVDIGRLFVVRAEMQSAADSAAVVTETPEIPMISVHAPTATIRRRVSQTRPN